MATDGLETIVSMGKGMGMFSLVPQEKSIGEK